MMHAPIDSITGPIGDIQHGNRASNRGTFERVSSQGSIVRREEGTTATDRPPNPTAKRSESRLDNRPEAGPEEGSEESSGERKGTPLTRALRSHQLWLTITYLGILVLMARGIAS